MCSHTLEVITDGSLLVLSTLHDDACAGKGEDKGTSAHTIGQRVLGLGIDASSKQAHAPWVEMSSVLLGLPLRDLTEDVIRPKHLFVVDVK